MAHSILAFEQILVKMTRFVNKIVTKTTLRALEETISFFRMDDIMLINNNFFPILTRIIRVSFSEIFFSRMSK